MAKVVLDNDLPFDQQPRCARGARHAGLSGGVARAGPKVLRARNARVEGAA